MRKKLPDGMLRSGKRSPFLIISIRLFTEVCHIEKYPRRGGLRGAPAARLGGAGGRAAPAKRYQKDFSTTYGRETDFGSMFHKKGGDRRTHREMRPANPLGRTENRSRSPRSAASSQAGQSG
jgi:hypothetical protein